MDRVATLAWAARRAARAADNRPPRFPGRPASVRRLPRGAKLPAGSGQSFCR